MAVIKMPSGATITTFPLPPSGLEILPADEKTLQTFGLPSRSALHHDHAQEWERVMSTPTRFIEPTFRRNANKRHGPARLRRTDAGEDSPNWSGAVATAAAGAAFTSAVGQWNVPNPNPASSDGNSSYSSSWVGIDGYGSDDVFQAGVECDAVIVEGGLQRQIYPWYEWFPEYEVEITNLPITAGDELWCLLTVISNTTGNVLLKNLTTGVATTFRVTPPTGTALVGNSVEWIVEAPGVDGAQSRLDDYGTVNFSGCSATTSTRGILRPEDGIELDMNQNDQIVSKAVSRPTGNLKCTYTGPVPAS